jgi:cell division transport system permease protein
MSQQPSSHQQPSSQMTAPILPGTGHSPMAGEGLTRVIAIMCFLASMALGAFLSINQATENWTSNLSQSVTVQLKPVPNLAPEAQLSLAMEVIAASPIVIEATPLTKEKSASLLEPWLGSTDLLTALPLPQLIDLKMDTSSQIYMDALTASLTEKVPGARLDDHRRWNDRLVRFASALQWLVFSVLALIITATAMIVVFATRADMSSNHEIIEVLHLIGAKDGFIAGQFQMHFLWIALWASLMGIGGAALTFLAMGQLSQADVGEAASAILPSLALQPKFYGALMIIPFMTVLTAALTARFTVIRVLKEAM